MGASAAGASSLLGAGKFKELRSRIWFLIGALVVFRFGTFIPVPGINPDALVSLMEQGRGTIIDMFNMFSGGALGRYSVFALGVMPYISASIIVQLLSQTLPSMIALRKEGESGRRKLTQYTRYGTVALAILQAVGVSIALQQTSAGGNMGAVIAPGPAFIFSSVVSLTAGTLFLMWLGEQVTERGIGNGISMIIFAGIVAGLPAAVAQTIRMAADGQLNVIAALGLLLMAIAIVAFVVFVERGQRRITVNYARRQGRVAYQNQSTHLPLKLNMSGVIPAIFASSVILFPASLASWFGSVPNLRWLQTVETMLGPGQPVYALVFGSLIVVFAFFYTALVFNSQETADNLKKSGALIPGIRPGKQTQDYIDGVITRLTAVGSIYLVAVCLLPDFVHFNLGAPFYLGGTSLLIVVVVVMDFMAQVQAHLMSHQYDSLLKKANLKSYGRSGLTR